MPLEILPASRKRFAEVLSELQICKNQLLIVFIKPNDFIAFQERYDCKNETGNKGQRR